MVSETVKVESPRSGFITRVDTTEIGHAIAAIGGGRVRIEDTIDPTVGFISELKIGDQVRAGEAIGVVYCARSTQPRGSGCDEFRRLIRSATNRLREVRKLVKEIINE